MAFEFGDKLSVPKVLGCHVGVYLGCGLVAHTTREVGPHISTVEEFANGKDCSVEWRGHVEPKLLWTRINSVMNGEYRYNIFMRNCEHFANYVISGVAKSPQIGKAIASVIVTALAVFAIRRGARPA